MLWGERGNIFPLCFSTKSSFQSIKNNILDSTNNLVFAIQIFAGDPTPLNLVLG